MKIAVTTSSFARHDPAPLERLASCGGEILLNPHGRKLTEEETVCLLKDCLAVVAGTEPYSAGVFRQLPRLKIISRCGVGMDAIDMSAAREAGVAVLNTPDGPTQAVAELTVGVILDLLRHISLMDREMRAGKWVKRMGRLLAGKKVGMVGMGRIGQATAGLLSRLDAQVAYADPCSTTEGFFQMPLDDLLRWADIVSLHCSKPSCPGSLIGEAELALMRPGALLVNLARGGLVDEHALAQALTEGKLAGAGIDVFAKEPYHGPLIGFDNVVLTPHVGSYALEGRVRMEMASVENLLAALEGIR